MKLLHLCEFHAPVGGLEQYLLDVCAAAAATGSPPVVIYGTRIGREPAEPGYRVHHVPGLADPTPLDPLARADLLRLLSEERPEVALVHEVLNLEVVRLVTQRVPTVRFVHGYKLICPGGRLRWNVHPGICDRTAGLACQLWAYRERCMPRNPAQGLRVIRRMQRLAALHRASSECLAPSGFVRDILIRNGFAPARVQVVPYFTSLSSASCHDTEGIPGRIFCAARLTPEKGVADLLQSLATLSPPAHLVIAGDGPSRAALGDLARSLGLAERVTFTGWLDRPAMAQALREAQVAAVPSLAPETFGIVGIEAMAHARPVVAYDSGGVREWLVPDSTGLLIPLGNLGALALALERLLADPARRRALGQAGRRRVAERFLVHHHLQGLYALAARALERWHPPAGAPRPEG